MYPCTGCFQILLLPSLIFIWDVLLLRDKFCVFSFGIIRLFLLYFSIFTDYMVDSFKRSWMALEILISYICWTLYNSGSQLWPPIKTFFFSRPQKQLWWASPIKITGSPSLADYISLRMFLCREEGNTSIIDDHPFTEKEIEALWLNEFPKVTPHGNTSSTYFPNASFSTKLLHQCTVLWPGILVMFQIIKGSQKQNWKT